MQKQRMNSWSRSSKAMDKTVETAAVKKKNGGGGVDCWIVLMLNTPAWTVQDVKRLDEHS